MPSEAAGWVAIGGIVGGAIGAAANWCIRWAASRDAAKRQRQRDTIDEWKDVAQRLREQNDRQEAVVSQLRTAVDALWAAESDCRESLAEHRQALHFMHNMMVRWHAILESECKKDMGPMPEMPPIRERARHDLDFLARQAQQSAASVSEAAKTLPPPPPVTGGT